ncbi:hypothetical protein DL96DRAFT_1614501, partial [Flagelloscypha sp. PMI_526]
MTSKRLTKRQAAIAAATSLNVTDRNANTPICKLPLEILSSIFFLYKDDVMEDVLSLGGRSPGLHYAVPYIAPSQVCIRFRSCCLDTPSLWSCLLLNHTSWCQELLRRSKQVPLDVFRIQPVKSGHNRTTFLRCFAYVLNESHRIRSIDLTHAFSRNEWEGGATWTDLPKYFTKALNSPLPSNLLKLALPKVPSNDSWVQSLFTPMLAKCWPNIRELGITETVLGDYKLRSERLVQLRLTLSSNSPIEPLLALFKHLPSLKTLALLTSVTFSFSALGASFLPRGFTLCLPHLHELEFVLPIDSCQLILLRLVEHRLKTIRIWPFTEAVQHLPATLDDTPSQVCKSVGDIFSFSTNPSYPCVDIGLNISAITFSFVDDGLFKWSSQSYELPSIPMQSILVSHKDAPPRMTHPLGSVPRNANIILSFPTRSQIVFQKSLDFLVPAFHHTRLVSLRTATLLKQGALSHSTSIVQLLDMLQRLPNLETLQIATTSEEQNVLFNSFDVLLSSTTPRPWVFPKLSNLQVQGFTFKAEYGLTEISCGAFIILLKFFQELGTPLRLVSLRDCRGV